jgi:hypothetical protein
MLHSVINPTQTAQRLNTVAQKNI